MRPQMERACELITEVAVREAVGLDARAAVAELAEIAWVLTADELRGLQLMARGAGMRATARGAT